MLGSEWVTVARIKWVFQQRFKEDAKPRFVLEDDGQSYILFTSDKKRVILRFNEGPDLHEFLISMQGDKHLWGSPNWQKLINKFKLKDKDSEFYLSSH